MSNRIKFQLPNDFGGLFSDCATHCNLYSACSGYDTAPCGCAWTVSSGKRYECDKCYLICRERRNNRKQDSSNSVPNNPTLGKFLNEVSISQPTNVSFPLFIPIETHLYKGDPLPINWAAVDIKTLFTKTTKKKAKLSSNFDTAAKTENFLNVKSGCKFLAVLNGKDRYLENLWGMGEINRRSAFKQLMSVGFSTVTGATYSVSNQTHQYTPIPQYHNISMLMRHHKVLDELQTIDFCSIPNIYWKDNDKKELDFWKNWLIDNPDIHTVSRDFTSTKNAQPVIHKIEELITLLKSVGRKFHVLIIGTGPNTAPMILQRLKESNFTSTFITSTPIYEARMAAERYTLINNKIIKQKDNVTPHSELILNNIRVFEEMLSSMIDNHSTNIQYT